MELLPKLISFYPLVTWGENLKKWGEFFPRPFVRGTIFNTLLTHFALRLRPPLLDEWTNECTFVPLIGLGKSI